TAMVTVKDVTPPTITSCSSDPVFFNGEDAFASSTFMNVVTSDACGLLNISYDPVEITCDQAGTTVMVTATVTDANGLTNTCTVPVAVGGVPCPFVTDPIGCLGEANFDNPAATFTQSSDGCQPFFPYIADETAFTYQTICGDGSIIAKVTSVTGGGFAGIMIRENLNPGARMISVGTNLINRVQRRVRVLPNYPAWPQQVYSLDKVWLRIDRMGFLFRAYIAEDAGGAPGTWIPYLSQYIQMGECAQVGIYTEGENTVATYTNVMVSGSGPVMPPALGSWSNPQGAEAGSQARMLDGMAEAQVFPNPSTGIINLGLGGFADQEVDVRIMNADGKVVQQRQLGRLDTANEQFDLGGLSAGMYMIQITTPDQAPIIKRVVLQPRP
ncbi:MAG: T9SS type A sorting domain-containing protein, partial [Bacteroidota bacterium]